MGGIDVVVNDQNPPGGSPRAVGAFGRVVSGPNGHVVDCRKPNATRCSAFPFTFTEDFNAPAMEFGEAFDDGEADAEASSRFFEMRVDLHEQVEDPGELLGGDPDALVPHAHDGFVSISFGGQRDERARGTVLGRI